MKCPDCNGDGAALFGDVTLPGGCQACEGSGVATCECGEEADRVDGLYASCADCRTCEVCGEGEAACTCAAPPVCTCPEGVTPADLRRRAACPMTSAADAEDLIWNAEQIERRLAARKEVSRAA